MFVEPIIVAITWTLAGGGLILGVFALIDAASRGSDVYPAADKRTKGVWLGITGASAAVFVLGVLQPFGAFGPPGLFSAAATVGSLVYLVDVRPRLKEVQSGGSRW